MLQHKIDPAVLKYADPNYHKQQKTNLYYIVFLFICFCLSITFKYCVLLVSEYSKTILVLIDSVEIMFEFVKY